MLHAIRARVARFSLAQQFLLASLGILLTGMIVIGWWVGRQIEAGVVSRTAAVTALYLDSFVAPLLQELGEGDNLSEAHLAELSKLLATTPLGQRVVAFKVWDPHGRVIFSTAPELIDRRFPVSVGLARALNGEVASHISDLEGEENVAERARWNRLVETYAPVRLLGTNRVIAVSEFYQRTDDLEAEIAAAQLRSWLLVGAATLVMYLLLAGLAGRASRLIASQQSALQQQVAQLTMLLEQNAHLHERVRRAAARTTALNERFLRRISADLHDGPAQDLSLALLRIDALADAYTRRVPTVSDDSRDSGFDAVRVALRNALGEVRAISAGLRLPELEGLPLAEVAARAVREYERRTQSTVELEAASITTAPLPVKITLYRLVQEALTNGFRHARGARQRVWMAQEDSELCVEVSDEGGGFDPTTVNGDQLGLAGMRERVEALGGSFHVQSAPGQGTRVRARLPLRPPEVNHE